MDNRTITELYDLTDKCAIVTGAAIGIGRAIALRLAEIGANIVVCDINYESAMATSEEIRANGKKAKPMLADVRNMEDAKRVTEAAIESFQRVDVLVNNAGVYPMSAVMDINEELWDKTVDTNLKGMFFYSQVVAKEMIRLGNRGKIINIASVDAFHPTGWTAHYNASKGGVVMLTKALALELAPHKILVNAIAPGSILTPGVDVAVKAAHPGDNRGTEELMEDFIRTRIPLGHMGQPDDIARVAQFLTSEAADYITGDTILVDGGFLLS